MAVHFICISIYLFLLLSNLTLCDLFSLAAPPAAVSQQVDQPTSQLLAICAPAQDAGCLTQPCQVSVNPKLKGQLHKISGLAQDTLCLTLQKTFLCLHIIIECLQKLLYILDRQLLMFSKKPCNMYTTKSSNVYIEPLLPAEETFLGLQKIFLC